MDTLREHVLTLIAQLMPPNTDQDELEQITDQALWNAIKDKKKLETKVRVKWHTTT